VKSQAALETIQVDASRGVEINLYCRHVHCSQSKLRIHETVCSIHTQRSYGRVEIYTQNRRKFRPQSILGQRVRNGGDDSCRDRYSVDSSYRRDRSCFFLGLQP
jgi:hypothetical protein